MKHARLSIRAPATGEVCLGGGGQVGALVACVVRGGGIGVRWISCVHSVCVWLTTQVLRGPVFLHTPTSQTTQAYSLMCVGGRWGAGGHWGVWFGHCKAR